MKCLGLALVAIALVLGCGTLEGPRTGTISPPTDALARWKDFPADRVPRPIVLLDDFLAGQAFDTGEAKLAAVCGKFAMSVPFPAEVPHQAEASWPDGTKYTYPAVSARDAFGAMQGGPGASSPDCSTVAPLPLTAARFGPAAFTTDRGKAQISAWLFKATGARVELAQPAVPKTSIWGGGVTDAWIGDTATVSPDGRVITYTFVGAAPPDQPCGAGYTGVVAESNHAVAVAVQSSPGRVVGGGNACPAIGYLRTVTIQLAGPLGGRVLVDASAHVVAVCPEAVRAGC